MTRMALLRAFAACAALGLAAAAATGALAQAFPQRNIVVINPFAAGGANDAIYYAIFDRVRATTGWTFVLEHRAGAGGSIGAAHVAKAAADGHTLLMANASALTSNPVLQKDIAYDPIRDFTPIALLVRQPLLLVVNASVPASGAREFVELLRSEPGRRNYGSYGPGTGNFFAFELFKQVTGTRIEHVPYRGSAPLANAMLIREVDAAFDLLPVIREQVAAGTMRILGVADDVRFDLLPDVPTLAEQGVPVRAETFVALAAPAGTPPAIADRINAEVNRALSDPEVARRLNALGLRVGGVSREAVGAVIAAEFAKISGLARDLGLKPE